MIKSMTGFGRCEHVQGDRKFTVEIKAVNHRYFDVNIKMPKKFNFFESAIRSVMKEYIQRGKVDVFITCEDDTENNFSLKYNENIAGEYLKYYRQMAQQFNLKDDVTVSRLGSCPEVFSMEEQMVDEDEIWALLETALRGALKQFVETRTREGENLKMTSSESWMACFSMWMRWRSAIRRFWRSTGAAFARRWTAFSPTVRWMSPGWPLR